MKLSRICRWCVKFKQTLESNLNIFCWLLYCKPWQFCYCCHSVFFLGIFPSANLSNAENVGFSRTVSWTVFSPTDVFTTNHGRPLVNFTKSWLSGDRSPGFTKVNGIFQPKNLRAKKLGTRSNISEHNLSREVVECGGMINKCGVLFMSMAISGTDWLEVPIPYIRPMFLGLCKGISPQNMAKNMVQYLYFRILEISHWLW